MPVLTQSTMELYAAGFNAWAQLRFRAAPKDDRSDALPSVGGSTAPAESEEPADLHTFTSVLRDDKAINRVYASLSQTFVSTAVSGQCTAGYLDDLIFDKSGIRERLLSSKAAIAGNGRVAVADANGSVWEYSSLAQFSRLEHRAEFCNVGPVVQVEAFETGFILLDTKGCVWTWGDERYAATLGRDVTGAKPADTPSVVDDLMDLPTGKIKKVSAAGYIAVALTEGHDMYAWGGHPGRPPLFEGLCFTPNPVVVDDAEDVLDCAVGDSHIITLASDGQVYVVGDNGNGQLGLPVQKTTTWAKVPIELDRPMAAQGVEAGPRNSFILMKHSNPF